MQFGQTDFIGRLSKAIGRHTAAVPAIAALACAATMAKPVEAATVDIFLIADHTTPTSGAGVPFSVTTNTVYQLGALNSNFKVTTATLVDNFTFNVNSALSFASLNDPASGPSSGAPNEPWLTDQGETGAGTAGYVNSEISTWENSGIPGTTVEADEQLDFGRNSSVTFDAVTGGFTDLVLTDLGGLNPFDLSLCSDASCSLVEKVFAGFKGSVTNFLTGLNVFSTSDTGPASALDQTWLFRFNDPISNFVRITEFDNRKVFTGARLQADFIGANGSMTPNPNPEPNPVPGPAGLPLLASGLGLLAWTLRRKKA